MCLAAQVGLQRGAVVMIVVREPQQQSGNPQLFGKLKLVFDQVIAEVKRGFDVSFNIEVIEDVRLTQGNLVRPDEHTPQRSSMVQDKGKTRVDAVTPELAI